MAKTLGPEGQAAEFLKHFSSLKDPRRTTKGNLQHLLSDIIILTVSAIICGADNWELVEVFGKNRTCYAYSELGHIEGYEKWEGLKSIVKIETETYEKVSGKTTKEQRYSISSLPPDAKVLNNNIRKHWSVENDLHWTLDVEFGVDRSRKRTRNAAENHNIVLKLVMTMLAMDNSKKTSKRSKRLKAALDPKYRDKLWGF
ncbi:MAG: ISAs1 family transposase [Salinivirgaceae bacterium]|jgi:predicted transposase YbfD/YdcC|nr:ISAs1 family transposase [Salinivirgaceae bacterium]